MFPKRDIQRGPFTAAAAQLLAFLLWLALCCTVPQTALALNGEDAKLTLVGLEGWKTFEVITQGDENGAGYRVPGEIDGVGAFLVNNATLRVLINHETGRACDTETDATVTEVDLDWFKLQSAITGMIRDDRLGYDDHEFVRRFRRAYDVIVDEEGSEGTRLFCSSQAYGPDSFGVAGEGFQDQIYLVGEEVKEAPYGRLFAIDSSTRRMYQVSGQTGDASAFQGGNGGMMWDSFENVALIRTFEKNHIAFLIGIDGGSEMLKLYVGQKNKNTDGEIDTIDFLARNGLAYGSWFYLKGSMPDSVGVTESGFFDSSSEDAVKGEKFEDVDTSPLHPTQVVLADEKHGVFVFDFSLIFSDGRFQSDAEGSSYIVNMIVDDSDSPINQADNVAWTASDLIYVATDGQNGAIWEMDSNGNDLVKIAASNNTADNYNPSGVIDISRFLGYEPASIFLAGTMSCGSSMSVLINPRARLTTQAKVLAETVSAGARRTTAPTAAPQKTNRFESSTCTYLCKEYPSLKWVSLNCGPCT